MPRSFLILLLCLATAGYAGVYKWVDEQGGVHYSDQSAAGAEKIDLPEPTIYGKPIHGSGQQRPSADVEPQGPSSADKDNGVAYTSIVITKPKMNDTVRSNPGVIPVSVKVEPGLQEKDRIRLVVDADPLPKDYSTTEFSITILDRGPHTLQAHVVNADGDKVASSAPVIFFLRRQSGFLRPSDSDPEFDRRFEQQPGVSGRPLAPMAPGVEGGKGRQIELPKDFEPRYEPHFDVPPQEHTQPDPSE